MDNLIPLNLLIGDRSYRVRIQPTDEEVVRKTVKTINDKLIEFKTMFAGKDMQDYIAMVLVWFATDQNAVISNQVNLDNVSSRLQTLEKMIDSGLEEWRKTVYLFKKPRKFLVRPRMFLISEVYKPSEL